MGNHITATLNGQRVHDNALLPAMTGGALDNDELSPGPIMIQGDHSRVVFRKMVVTPIVKVVTSDSRMGREPAGWPGVVIAAVFFALIFHARPAAGYSILAHEGLVDTLWADEIVPLLRDRFPGLTAADLARARAYAYGGSLIQDLGYYPFGSHLFTNLTHYARTGDFVQSLIRNAITADEYAFALGALAHYSADTAGHPIAVNRAVPLMYPKVRAEVGERALYVDSPVRHVMVEFGYDVLAVARGAYVAQAYRDRIGFEVSKPLLERAVRETYAIELGDLLFNVDLAIGTYRRAVSKTIPELTRIAWRDKRQEIEQRTPGITEQAFSSRCRRATTTASSARNTRNRESSRASWPSS